MRALSVVLGCLLVSQCLAIRLHDSLLMANIERNELLNPLGVAVGPNGTVYVSDSGRGTILSGSSGVYSNWVTGLHVGSYNGIRISALGIHATQDGQVLFGEGGYPTGVDQVFHYSSDGALVNAFPAVGLGGNWFGVTTDSVTGDLFAMSSNGDQIYRSARGGATWGNLTPWRDLTFDGIVSPTAAVAVGDWLYFTAYGSFISTSGGLYRTSISQGGAPELVLADLSGPTGLAKDSEGNLYFTEYGSFVGGPGFGTLKKFNTGTQAVTLIADEIGYATNVARDSNGTLYLTEMRTPNEPNGNLWRIQAVPEPASLSALGLGLIAVLRRRQANCSKNR